MFFRILFLTVALKFVFTSAALSEQFEVDPANSGNAPFFELPCMVVGGTCARSVACPIGTKVGEKGLCPVQQDLGMECCRPLFGSKTERCEQYSEACQNYTSALCVHANANYTSQAIYGLTSLLAALCFGFLFGLSKSAYKMQVERR